METLVFDFISGSIYILSDMSTLFPASIPKRSVLLWRAIGRAVQPLRPACSRTTTFLWLMVVLAALCLRPDLAGVTSLVRGLGFGVVDAPLASDSPAPVPPASGAGQRPRRGAGRWHQAAQGRQKDAGGEKLAPRVPLQRQGILYHGTFPPGCGHAGPCGGRLYGCARGGPHSRGRGLEQPRPAHPAG